MRRYSAAEWSRLGQAVQEARMASGLGDTKEWASKVGRSTRTLLGLERGETIGVGTMRDIERALGWPDGACYRILSGGVEWQQFGTVGADPQNPPDYVSGPGEKVEGGASESDVLRAIEAMRQDVQAMERRLSERLDRLEGGS